MGNLTPNLDAVAVAVAVAAIYNKAPWKHLLPFQKPTMVHRQGVVFVDVLLLSSSMH